MQTNPWIAVVVVATACGSEVRFENPGSGGAGGEGSGTVITEVEQDGGSGATAPMSTATGGGQGGAGAGSSAFACESCIDPVVDSCEPQVDACEADPGCNAWLDCSDDCFSEWTDACWTGCQQAHAGSSALWQPILACICGPCAGPCAPACQ